MSFALPSHAFFWNKKDKALEKELQGKGYAGTLPNLGDKIEKTKTKVTTPIFESQDGFNNPADLKPVPKDNPAFINIIQKKDKTSEFTNDAAEIIPMLEKLVDCIDDNENLQLFITKANLLTLNIDNLTEKYNGKPESYYESFRKLQEVNRYVKSIAALRREAVTYQRYLAYSSSGSIYNPDNINQQLQYLLEELNSAILLLRSDG
ncbi:unknown [Acinetobacter sp. CAG:196]|nr:unknown [Acinetobacter sp. CAG:196]